MLHVPHITAGFSLSPLRRCEISVFRRYTRQDSVSVNGTTWHLAYVWKVGVATQELFSCIPPLWGMICQMDTVMSSVSNNTKLPVHFQCSGWQLYFHVITIHLRPTSVKPRHVISAQIFPTLCFPPPVKVVPLLTVLSGPEGCHSGKMSTCPWCCVRTSSMWGGPGPGCPAWDTHLSFLICWEVQCWMRTICCLGEMDKIWTWCWSQ